jgi:SAM-dependent methyltransferase
VFFSKAGAVGAIQALGSAARLWLRSMTVPIARLLRGSGQQLSVAELEFDRRYGVETAGTELPARSEVSGRSWWHGTRYQAVDPNAFHQVFGELNITFEEFTFVDLGAGKGRALLLASHYPFFRIVGVEYSKSLAETARRNAARFAETAARGRRIEVVCGDAVEFTLPMEPLLLFLYNPFGLRVMKQIVGKVSESFARRPRRIVVTYFNPVHGHLWARQRLIKETRRYATAAVYETQPQIGALDGGAHPATGET